MTAKCLTAQIQLSSLSPYSMLKFPTQSLVVLLNHYQTTGVWLDKSRALDFVTRKTAKKIKISL